MNCMLFHRFTPGLAQGLLHRDLINVEQCNLSNLKIIYKINVGEVKRPIKPIILFLFDYIQCKYSSGRNLEAFEIFFYTV